MLAQYYFPIALSKAPLFLCTQKDTGESPRVQLGVTKSNIRYDTPVKI